MYTILQDLTPSSERVKITLNSVGRSLFRIAWAKFFIAIGLVFIVAVSMITAQINLKTAERNYANHISDVRAESISHLKVAISKLQ